MDKIKVLLTTDLPGKAEKLLTEAFALSYSPGSVLSPDELAKKAKNQDAIICDLSQKITESLLAECPHLKIVANVAVGIDNIDLEACRKRSILVTNTPGVLDDSTADLAFALLLALARRLNEAEKFLRAGQWKKFSLNLLFGIDVHHKTLGIIGLGRIGQCMARRAKGFSMRILYHQNHRLSPEEEKELAVEYVSLDELLQQSDFISLHCPLNKKTFHLISQRELSLVKPGCHLINASRGAVVDEKALIEALKNGHLGGAGLDVFEQEPNVSKELLAMDNVLAVPHIGSATKETRSAMARLAVEAVISAFAGIEPANLVNKEAWPNFLSSLKSAKSAKI